MRTTATSTGAPTAGSRATAPDVTATTETADAGGGGRVAMPGTRQLVLAGAGLVGAATAAERWLPVMGWEGLYEVSDHGRVRSLDRVIQRNGADAHLCGRVLRPRAHPQGYVAATLSRDGRYMYPLVHTLVLEAFVGPRPEGTEGCHWNGDRTDNRIHNIRWDTPAGNAADKVRHGTTTRRTRCRRGHRRVAPNLRANGACAACHCARSNFTTRTDKTEPWTEPTWQAVADEHYARITGGTGL